jgi:heme-degrading monooxygenase HmoA
MTISVIYQPQVGEQLRAVSGFRGARLLRQEDGREVLFTFFTSLDAVRGFAGDDYRQAIVGDAARQALSRFRKSCANKAGAMVSDFC